MIRSHLARRWPRRLSLLGTLAALAVGVALPATAQAAPLSSGGCAGNVSCIQAFGNAQIAKRLTALGTLGGKVSFALNAQLISADQANTLQSNISGKEGQLTTIKGSLDQSGITAQQARQDVQQIYTTCRIYLVVLPRDYRILALDIATTVDAKMQGLEPVLHAAIGGAPAGERQQLTSLYNDFVAQINEAEAQIDAAQGQIATLTVAAFNGDKSAFESNWQYFVNDEKAVHTATHAAATDLHELATILKG